MNIININLFAQNLTDSINPNTKFKKNAVFVELLGSNFVGASVNYNRNFYISKKIYLSGGTGVGYSPIDEGTPVFPIRITINLKNVELGIGVSNFIRYTKVSSYGGYGYGYNEYGWRFPLGTYRNKNSNLYLLNLHPIIGYNIINNNKTFAFCINFTPLYLPWGGDPLLLWFWGGIKMVYFFG